MKTKAAQEISVLQKICNVMRLSEANLTVVMTEMSSLSVEIIEDLAEQLTEENKPTRRTGSPPSSPPFVISVGP